MLADPLNESFPRQIASGQTQDYGFRFINACIQFKPVQDQEDFHRCVANPLITVYERMVADEQKAKCCSFVGDRWVEI